LTQPARQRNRHAVDLKVVAMAGLTSALARKPEHQHAGDTADAMHAKHVERVVIGEMGF
jgi:hypothetical protein